MKKNSKSYLLASALIIILFCLLSVLESKQIQIVYAQSSPSDPVLPGDSPLSQQDYIFGDQDIQPQGFVGRVEFRGRAYWPSNLNSGAPFPLIVLLHGKHDVCHNGSTTEPPHNIYGDVSWPCPTDYPYPVWNYQGYDYIGQTLASSGYIVISISTNGINALDNNPVNDPNDGGAYARAQLIQTHLDYWDDCNTNTVEGCAPFGMRFVGKINMQRIATMGHSRGGEGVIRHIQYNQQLGSPYAIKGVLPLAPTDFNRFTRANAPNIPIGVLLSYCDGDVDDLQGVYYFDDSRFAASPVIAHRHIFLVMGANHNYYNTVWTSGTPGAGDDWSPPPFGHTPDANQDVHCRSGASERLSPQQQQVAGLRYVAAFMRTYANNSNFDADYIYYGLLTGDTAASGLPTVHTSYQPIRQLASPPFISANWRLDINSLTVPANLTNNNLGGNVTRNGLDRYALCGGNISSNCLPLQYILPSPPFGSWAQEPHNGNGTGVSQLDMAWSGTTTAYYRNDIPPANRNLFIYEALQFRMAVNFSDNGNSPGAERDISVTLSDGTRIASVPLSTVYGTRPNPYYYPPGSGRTAYNSSLILPVPHIILNTVRIPISQFTAQNSNLDLGNIQSVEVEFNRSNQGAILISDLQFTNSLCPSPTPPSVCATEFHFQDVPANNTFEPYVHCLVCRGVLGGYGCGGEGLPCVCPNKSPYFLPGNNITRGQLAKIASNSAYFTDPHSDQIFEDIPLNHTFYIYIARLASRGYIVGYPCGGPNEPCGTGNRPYFRPNANVTRGQTAKIVSNTANYNEPVSNQTFEDVPSSHAFYPFIQRLSNRNVMGGYPCIPNDPNIPCVAPNNRPYFLPWNNNTRGQAAKIVANTFFSICYPLPPELPGNPDIPQAVVTNVPSIPQPVPTP